MQVFAVHVLLCWPQAGHKLLKIGIQEGQEIELVTMIIECCSQVGARGWGVFPMSAVCSAAS